jgi:putative tryptophan/tyrosine transport system substrate-binding protein
MKSILLLIVLVLAAVYPAEAQQLKIPRIGIVFAGGRAAVAARMVAFRAGLNALGYTEGKSIIIVDRYAEGKLERIPALVNELERLKIDVIVSGGPAVTRAAKEATSTLPIVVGFDSDPIGSGFVASLSRPGGRITGLSSLSPEISGKQLELLNEIVPKLQRVTVFGSSTEPGNAQMVQATELASAAYGVRLLYIDINDSRDIETAFRSASKGRADAVLALTNPITFAHRSRVISAAIKSRLPVTYYSPEFVEDGGLMTYSVSFTDLFRRAATYVDKILKGAEPANLPVEQPTKFELVINLKAAKQIGLTVPPQVLARADRVIK